MRRRTRTDWLWPLALLAFLFLAWWPLLVYSWHYWFG